MKTTKLCEISKKGIDMASDKSVEGKMQRQVHLDILRIMATYAVILLHTASKKMGGY